MRRLLRLWLISTLLACTIALSAAPGNVILILCNGVNLAQLELARQAGIRRAGLSGMAALPSAGTLLPLTGRYRSQQIAALNALASGYAGDTTLGVTSSGDELESLLGEARLQGRRTGFITTGREERFSPARIRCRDWTGSRRGFRSATSIFWGEPWFVPSR